MPAGRDSSFAEGPEHQNIVVKSLYEHTEPSLGRNTAINIMESQRGPQIIIIIFHMYATQIIIMFRILIIISGGPIRQNVRFFFRLKLLLLLLLLLLLYTHHSIYSGLDSIGSSTVSDHPYVIPHFPHKRCKYFLPLYYSHRV